MANISFFQVIIFLILIFLMFGNIENFKQNFANVKLFFSKKEESIFSSKKNQEKRDSNP